MSSLANIAGRLMRIHRSLAEPHSPVPLSVDRVPRSETRIDHGHPNARRVPGMLQAPTPAAAARWPSLEASTLLEDALSRFKIRSTSAFPDVAKVDGWVPAAAPAPTVAESSAAPADESEPPLSVVEPTAPPVPEAKVAATELQATEPESVAARPERPAIEPPSPTMNPEAVAAWILVHLGELLGRIPPSTAPSPRRAPRDPLASIPSPPAQEPARGESPIRDLPLSACSRRIRLRRRPVARALAAPESVPGFRLPSFPGVPEEFRSLDAPGVPAELLVSDLKPEPAVSDTVPICVVPAESDRAPYHFNPLDCLLVPDRDRHEPTGRTSLDRLFSVPLIPEDPVQTEPEDAAPSRLIEPSAELFDDVSALLIPPFPIEPEDPEIIAEPLHRLFSPPVEPEEEEIDDEIPHWFLSLPAQPKEEPAVDEIEIPHWLFSIPAGPEDEPNVDEPMDWLFSAPAEPFVTLYRGEPQPKLPAARTPPGDDQVRRRAYELWQAAGSPPSDGREFWTAALRDLGLAD